MDAVTVSRIKTLRNRVSATIETGLNTHDIFYEFPENVEVNERAADALLVLSLPVAMSLGKRLKIEGRVSTSLLVQLDTYQDILQKWYHSSGYRKISIDVAGVLPDIPARKKAYSAATFTGGVDSFYTLLRHKEEISHLFYIHGLDIRLSEERFLDKVSSHLNTVAKGIKVKLIEPRTNCKDFIEAYTDWREVGYGPAIASTILLTNHNIGKFFIPGAEDYNFLSPEATHLLINPLWNSNGIEFIYDGPEASRIEKVEFIFANKLAQENLRVCWQSTTTYNCGLCEKCIRTMVALDIVGGIAKYKHLFAAELNVDVIKNMSLHNTAERSMAVDSYEKAVERNKTAIADGLREQIRMFDIHLLVDEVNKNIDHLLRLDEFKNIQNKIFNHSLSYGPLSLFLRIPKKILGRGRRFMTRNG